MFILRCFVVLFCLLPFFSLLPLEVPYQQLFNSGHLIFHSHLCYRIYNVYNIGTSHISFYNPHYYSHQTTGIPTNPSALNIFCFNLIHPCFLGVLTSVAFCLRGNQQMSPWSRSLLRSQFPTISMNPHCFRSILLY